MVLFVVLFPLGHCLAAGELTPFELRHAAQVDGSGVFLNQLVECDPPAPAVRLCDAPAFGKAAVLSRSQIGELIRAAGADVANTNWAGSETIRLSRMARTLSETELLQFLTTALQEQHVKDRGELELRFCRAWAAVSVPDEPLTIKVLDVPVTGVTPAFITRFEVETARGEKIGSWQAAMQARIWREVWVARTAVKRGESVPAAELTRERRDMLACREPLADFDREDPTLEMAEPLCAGAPVLARSIRPRAVIHRGQSVAGLLQDGALTITMMVEALENGAPGQIIRLRNPVSRRDLRGKVLDERQILLSL